MRNQIADFTGFWLLYLNDSYGLPMTRKTIWFYSKFCVLWKTGNFNMNKINVDSEHINVIYLKNFSVASHQFTTYFADFN